MLCGITHAIHSLAPFQLPTLHATFKVLCGLVSIITAVYLVKFVPAALKLPNYTAYLEYEIQERQASEKTLRSKNEEMVKLRSCLEVIRHTLTFQAILNETTSSLCTNFDLESCFFVHYTPENNSLGFISPYLNDPHCPLVKSLRTTSPNAISAYKDICSRAQAHVLEYADVESLFGAPVALHYANKWGSGFTPSKSVACAHISLDGVETALLILSQVKDDTHILAAELDIIRDIANQVEIALSQARSIERDRNMLQELQRKNSELAQAQQQAQQAIQAKSKFIAIMSHEMRTPLYVITALAELLMDSSLSSEVRESLSTILASGQMLLSNISDVLDYSKFQQDNFVMDKAPFNIRTCIEKCVDIAAVKAHEAGLKIYYHLREGFPEVIDTDEARLSQVFLNLLSNGVKFTKKGMLQIEGHLDSLLTNDEIAQLYGSSFGKSDTRSNNYGSSVATSSATIPYSSSSSVATSNSSPTTLRNLPPPGTRMAKLRFTVTDTGLGIPRDQIPRLFEEFMQLDNSATRKYEGTGLGLAICRRIVTLMGGQIGVDSTPGEGSRFHFYVVAKIPPPSIAQPLQLPTNGVRGSVAMAIVSTIALQKQLSDVARELGLTLAFYKTVHEAISHLEKVTATVAANTPSSSDPSSSSSGAVHIGSHNSAAPRPFAAILIESTLINRDPVRQYRLLNQFAPSIIIGDLSTLRGLSDEFSAPGETMPPGRRCVNLPVKYINLYLSLRNAIGSLSDAEYDSLHARVMDIGNRQSMPGSTTVGTRLVRDLVRSTSGASNSSSSSADSLASPRGGFGSLASLGSSSSLASTSSTNSASTTSGGSTSSFQFPPQLPVTHAPAVIVPTPLLSSGPSSLASSSSNVGSAIPSSSGLGTSTPGSNGSASAPSSSSKRQDMPPLLLPGASSASATHHHAAKLVGMGGSVGSSLVPSSSGHHMSHLDRSAVSHNVGGGGNGLPTFGQLTGFIFDSLSSTVSNSASTSHSSFFTGSKAPSSKNGSSSYGANVHVFTGSGSGDSSDEYELAGYGSSYHQYDGHTKSSGYAGDEGYHYSPNPKHLPPNALTTSSSSSSSNSHSVPKAPSPQPQVSPPHQSSSAHQDGTLLAAQQQHLQQFPFPVSLLDNSTLEQWQINEDLNVLLVEDNTLCRKVCLKQLNRLGVERVDVAFDGQEALDQALIKDYDLIMMDVMMPGLDGISATRVLRQRELERSQSMSMAGSTASTSKVATDDIDGSEDDSDEKAPFLQRERAASAPSSSPSAMRRRSSSAVVPKATPSAVASDNADKPRQPYIIAITASSMLEEGSREACISAGMDDVVTKPVNLRALHDALNRFFESRNIVPGQKRPSNSSNSSDSSVTTTNTSSTPPTSKDKSTPSSS